MPEVKGLKEFIVAGRQLKGVDMAGSHDAIGNAAPAISVLTDVFNNYHAYQA
ncbi:MAG: hypothetical protein HY809_10975 [Nitrospirae bacterium]|nr:hypothetical protein [Nitrospirota bacterium]